MVLCSSVCILGKMVDNSLTIADVRCYSPSYLSYTTKFA